ncbi:hypothetical protein DAI22_03g308400 [Oryza sativa Japonica Group]|nr:hypothetical protein DAI22_03g308400 [Oryza sativa Japonica Group]
MHAGGGPTEGVDGPRPPPSSRPYVRTGHSGPSSLPSGPHRPYAAAEPATPPQQRGLCLAKKPASISHHARARSRRARLAPTTPPTPPRPVSRSRARDDALRACACVRSEGGVTARRTVAQRRTYCGARGQRQRHMGLPRSGARDGRLPMQRTPRRALRGETVTCMVRGWDVSRLHAGAAARG